MKKAEIILIITAIIGIALSLIPVPGGNILTILSITFLACMYFYFGFAIFNGIRFRDIFRKASYQGISALHIVGAIAVGMSASAVIIGLLFKFMMWQGGGPMLFVGGASLLLIAIVALIKYIFSKSPYYLSILKRAVPLTLLAIVFLWLYNSTWQQIRYRNHPEYVKALQDLDREPNNKEYIDKVEEEEAKFRQMGGEE